MAVNRSRTAKAQSIVAPVGGLNDKDSLADMPPQDAIQLDNWFPETHSVRVRGGSVVWATGMSTTGETLLPYSGVYSGSMVNKIFAAAGGNIYDVTSTGPLVGTAASGKTNARWDYTHFSNAGGTYLVAVNGADQPIFYNGSAWTYSGAGAYATAITGTTAQDFTQVAVWKGRLFFVKKNSLSCWYLGAGNIGGAATELSFGGVAKLGGKLVAIASLSSSAGVTPDDYFVAITDQGECLVYRGTDPASASTFALVGNYRIGRPIANGSDKQGGRFLTRYGADIVAITADGFTTLQAMINADVQAKDVTINDKIINSVNSAVQSYKDNFGWQACLCPIQNKLIINVPSVQNTNSYQFVMNTVTGAWCKFTGWNATCFASFQDEIYAIIGDSVYKVDVAGANDFTSSTSTGTPITATAKSAFIYFGQRGTQKHYTMARPLMNTSGGIVPYVDIDTDFSDNVLTGTADISIGVNGATWNYSKWQPYSAPATWGSDNLLYQDWISVFGIGYCAAIKIQVKIDSNTCKWSGWDMLYQIGGLI